MSRNKQGKRRIRLIAGHAYEVVLGNTLRRAELLEKHHEASLEHEFRRAITRAFEDQRREREGGIAGP